MNLSVIFANCAFPYSRYGQFCHIRTCGFNLHRFWNPKCLVYLAWYDIPTLISFSEVIVGIFWTFECTINFVQQDEERGDRMQRLSLQVGSFPNCSCCFEGIRSASEQDVFQVSRFECSVGCRWLHFDRSSGEFCYSLHFSLCLMTSGSLKETFMIFFSGKTKLWLDTAGVLISLSLLIRQNKGSIVSQDCYRIEQFIQQLLHVVQYLKFYLLWLRANISIFSLSLCYWVTG